MMNKPAKVGRRGDVFARKGVLSLHEVHGLSQVPRRGGGGGKWGASKPSESCHGEPCGEALLTIRSALQRPSNTLGAHAKSAHYRHQPACQTVLLLLFHRGLVLHTYCRFISMTLPEDFLPPLYPSILHLVSLSSRGKGGGGLCQPFCALHDKKRTDGRCVSSPPPAHVVSPLRPCRAKRGANERTTRRADGICV